MYHQQSNSLDYRLDYVIEFLSCWCVIFNCYKLPPLLHVDMNQSFATPLTPSWSSFSMSILWSIVSIVFFESSKPLQRSYYHLAMVCKGFQSPIFKAPTPWSSLPPKPLFPSPLIFSTSFWCILHSSPTLMLTLPALIQPIFLGLN